MALITKAYTFSAGATIVAAEHNSNFDTIYNEFNGLISNANVSPSAAITDSKLAQITTAGKVSGAAITLMTSLPSGAGLIPTANLGSGTANSTTFLRGDQTYAAATPTAATALSGSVIQTVKTEYATYASLGTTTIPLDDTPPTWAEGNQVSGLATSITPNNTSNRLRITVTAHFSQSSTDVNGALCLFQDPSGTDSSKQAWTRVFTDTTAGTVTGIYEQAAGTVSSTTFKFRVGDGNGGNYVINGKAAATAGRVYGGTLKSYVVIEEIKA